MGRWMAQEERECCRAVCLLGEFRSPQPLPLRGDGYDGDWAHACAASRTSLCHGRPSPRLCRCSYRLASFTEPACRASRAWLKAWAWLVGPPSWAEPNPNLTEPGAPSFLFSPTCNPVLFSQVDAVHLRLRMENKFPTKTYCQLYRQSKTYCT